MEQRDGGVEIPLRAGLADIALPEPQASRGASERRASARRIMSALRSMPVTVHPLRANSCACTPVPQPRSSSVPVAAPWRRSCSSTKDNFRSVILVLIQEVVPWRISLEGASRKNLLQTPAQSARSDRQSGQGRSEDRSRGVRSVRRWDGNCWRTGRPCAARAVHACTRRRGGCRSLSAARRRMASLASNPTSSFNTSP